MPHLRDALLQALECVVDWLLCFVDNFDNVSTLNLQARLPQENVKLWPLYRVGNLSRRRIRE